MDTLQKKPFAFELTYQIPGEETLRDVLLTENRILELRVTNMLLQGDEPIFLEPVTTPSSEDHHFLLQFKQGLLAPNDDTHSPDGAWKVHREDNAALGTTDIYLGWSGETKRLEAGETLSIPLQGLFTNPETRSTLPLLLSWPEPRTEMSSSARLRVELRIPGQGDEYETESYLLLQKLEWSGRANIPLRLDVVGPHQVLNVDNQPNTLVLRLSHSAPPGSQEQAVVFDYVASQPSLSSSLQLQLPVGDPATRPFALGTSDQLNGVSLSLEGFTPAAGVTSPDGTMLTFKLTPSAPKTLAPGGFLELTLSGLVTGHPSGRTNVDLAYAQLAGFRDGKLSCLVEKTPLTLGRDERRGNVGIASLLGEDQPAARLLLRTGTEMHGLNHTDDTVTVGTYVGTGDMSSGHQGGWLGTRARHPLHFFTGNGDPQVTLSTEGKLGIGTPTPGASLDVHGDTLIRGDRLGIGAKALKAGLEVHGNAVIHEGRLGIKATSPDAALNINESFFIKGAKPFHLKKYEFSETVSMEEYNSNEWIPHLAGFTIRSGYWSYGPALDAFEAFFSAEPGGPWRFTCEISREGNRRLAEGSITVLFIRCELAERKTT